MLPMKVSDEILEKFVMKIVSFANVSFIGAKFSVLVNVLNFGLVSLCRWQKKASVEDDESLEDKGEQGII